MGRNAITILVTGAAGRMGQEVIRAVCAQDDMRLVGAVDPRAARTELGPPATGLTIQGGIEAALGLARPDVMVDFTTPTAVMPNLRAALAQRVACVVGTTGLSAADLEEMRGLCEATGTPAVIAPNFAIGAVLMMQFARQAARHFSQAEVIELHHDAKRDAPSGTALLTANLMASVEGCALAAQEACAEAPRGQLVGGKVRVHSVRLPGLVAHQEVIFGGLGQTLTIRHDSLTRESFMPGVLLAIRKVRSLSGLTHGLEHLL